MDFQHPCVYEIQAFVIISICTWTFVQQFYTLKNFSYAQVVQSMEGRKDQIWM
jgi:hypothetical protein